MEFGIILLVVFMPASASGYFMTDNMMDAIWEYYLPLIAFIFAALECCCWLLESVWE